MTQQRVAVIGAGAAGLSMMKTLREDGFKVTCYERRKQVGGLWAYTADPSMTTALPSTRALISKYTCGMSDFPMPDKYPHHLTQPQFQEYMQTYAEHFDLLKDITFDASVKAATWNKADSTWQLTMDIDGEEKVEEFDKVAFCHGYHTKQEMPTFEGQDLFEGTLMHAQQFRNPEAFEGKTIVVLGMSSSASDIINNLLPITKKIYMSHRRGGYIFPTWRNGYPADLTVNWRRRQMGAFLQHYFPRFAKWAADAGLRLLMKQSWGKLNPEWRVLPAPSITLSLPGASDTLVPLLREGKITSVHGIKRFTGPQSMELNDGTVLDNIDAVICSTGYSADLDVATSFLSTTPSPKNYAGPPLSRLWMNIFPPEYANSMALLCYSAFGKNNGFSFNDVVSMAVSNVFRGTHPIPPRVEMEAWVDQHNEWLAECWRQEPDGFDRSMVKTWEFQAFLHDAAGTGMENLGFGWKGWMFFLKDPKMSWLMNHGLETAHAFRYFETGKRKTWPGAREAIIHANDTLRAFPIKDEEKRNVKVSQE